MSENITNEILRSLLPRPEESHKGTFGTLTALIGSPGMPGAACLSAMAALRSGIGLLRIAADGDLRTVLQAQLAEPVWISPSDLTSGLGNAFLCGCGIGRTYDTLLFNLLPAVTVPSVLDADALNFISANHQAKAHIPSGCVLTPHPAEFARLTCLSVREVQEHREQLAQQFATAYGCTVVLKGHATVVADATRVCVNTTGNSALAKGGSGDVLAGLIAGLLTQGHDPFTAASIGVYVHGLAAENLSERLGKHGTLPSDLPLEIGRILM